MKPYYQDNHIRLYTKDCRQMWELADNSVQCVVTSPPYWGLRKYSGEQELIWGDDHCEHRWVNHQDQAEGYTGTLRWVHGDTGRAFQKDGQSHAKNRRDNPEAWSKDIRKYGLCSLCGAWKGAYGLEPTPEMYVHHTIEILREIRRVLRKDGVVFWNIGDSYWGGKGQSGQPMSAEVQQQRYEQGESINQAQHQMEMSTRPQDGKHPCLKPKDLCLIPFRIAIAAQEDGWWVRSVIIWSKPNPMPESVTDRPTESHEYILMLTKSARYYWDADAVREEYSPTVRWGGDKYKGAVKKGTHGEDAGLDRERSCFPSAGRNIRTVWEFPTQPYPEAHFAVFPEKLPELCIKATTPEVGCCSKCGAPWERIVDRPFVGDNTNRRTDGYVRTGKDGLCRPPAGAAYKGKTLGWQPTCKCDADKVPSLVLDPFAGAGTTLWVAKKLNRQAVGYEISEEYCELALERNRQQVLELS